MGRSVGRTGYSGFRLLPRPPFLLCSLMAPTLLGASSSDAPGRERRRHVDAAPVSKAAGALARVPSGATAKEQRDRALVARTVELSEAAHDAWEPLIPSLSSEWSRARRRWRAWCLPRLSSPTRGLRRSRSTSRPRRFLSPAPTTRARRLASHSAPSRQGVIVPLACTPRVQASVLKR